MESLNKSSTYTEAHFRAQKKYREKFPEKYLESQKKFYERKKQDEEWKKKFNERSKTNNKIYRDKLKEELIKNGGEIKKRGRPKKQNVNINTIKKNVENVIIDVSQEKEKSIEKLNDKSNEKYSIKNFLLNYMEEQSKNTPDDKKEVKLEQEVKLDQEVKLEQEVKLDQETIFLENSSKTIGNHKKDIYNNDLKAEKCIDKDIVKKNIIRIKKIEICNFSEKEDKMFEIQKILDDIQSIKNSIIIIDKIKYLS